MASEAQNTQYASRNTHHFLRVTGHERRDTKEFVRIYKLFMQNKAKVKSAKINLSSFLTSKYVQVWHLVIQTTKPIQTQFKPIKANLTQFVERKKTDANFPYTRAYEENAAISQKNKPNSNPIFLLRKG